MNVLHVLDHSLPVVSGYSSRSRSIVDAQMRLGLRPVVLTSPKHPLAGPAHEVLDGVPHYRTPSAARGFAPPYAAEILSMLRLASRIVQVARREHATLLHAHSPVLNGLPALWASRKLGLPLIYETRAFWEDAAVDHGTTREGSVRYRLSRGLETFLFRRADRVVTIAEAMRAEIVGRGVSPLRIRVVPNGVDTDRLRPAPRNPALAARLGLDGGPVLGFVGSFYRYEGLGFLLEAVPELAARLPGLRVVLVGGGEEDAELRRTAAGLGDTVVLPGVVPPADVGDFYGVMDVFVCPRRRMRLTELVTPLKPLEAMAMAKPVLASDVGGLKELIRDGVTGLLFAPESRNALVASAVRLASDADLRQRLAGAAREHVVKERRWDHLVSRYVDLYAELV